MPLFQNNFGTNITSNTTAGDTTTPLNSIPTIDAPYYLALDATNLNSHYEVIYVTSDTATNVNHAATSYAHTTAEEVRLVVPAVHLNTMQNFPEGTLINGKIVPTDAAGLTLTLQTKAGANPSVTDPVYVMIGGTIRSITAALSVAKADGTNWFNAGGAELATKEIDYFAYLGYNATDGVVLGFSRIPFATLYSDFSTTTTDEKYCAISTITNAAAGDNYVNIGRFAATLSAGAGYTWTVPTFTTGNLIQRPIYETRWLTWTPTLAWTGGAAPTGPDTTTYYVSKYKVSYKSCSIIFGQTYSGAGTTITQMTGTTPLVLMHPFGSEMYPLYGIFSNTNAPILTLSEIYAGDHLIYLFCASSTVNRVKISGTYEI
jgi:hypothetical protein